MTADVYQIFYNDETRAALDPGFIPLDNCNSVRPDWLEFWVILNFLRTHELDDARWYGFLSPKFHQKTGWDSRFVHDTVSRHGADADVLLFSPFIDELAVYQNTFEQAEWWHPGIFATMQKTLAKMGVGYDPARAVDTLTRSVFCNYVVARPSYWRSWRDVAERLFDLAERDDWARSIMNAATIHDEKSLPVKLFVQERLTSVVLAEGRFRTHVPPENLAFSRHESPRRDFLLGCEYLKQLYVRSGDPHYLQAFRDLRHAHYGYRLFLG